MLGLGRHGTFQYCCLDHTDAVDEVVVDVSDVVVDGVVVGGGRDVLVVAVVDGFDLKKKKKSQLKLKRFSA